MIASDVLLYLGTGVFAGLMSGALGIGGGIIIIPALLLIFQHSGLVPAAASMHVAAGTSLAILMLTAQASVRAHRRLGDILWHVYRRLYPGLILGTVAGALLAKYIPSDWLEQFFGLFLLLVSLNMLRGMHLTVTRQFPPDAVHYLVSSLIGFQSGLLGIGGGLLIVPYLTWCGIDVRKIVAVSASCTMTVSVVGTLAMIVSGWHEPGLPGGATGYVYWPAVFWIGIPSSLVVPLGARMTYVLPVRLLRLVFILLMVATAITMLF